MRIHNCTIENTRGIDLVWGLPGSIVSILRNRHTNIKGHGTSPVGNFVQLREIHRTSVFEVAWNEIINEYDKSSPGGHHLDLQVGLPEVSRQLPPAQLHAGERLQHVLAGHDHVGLPGRRRPTPASQRDRRTTRWSTR